VSVKGILKIAVPAAALLLAGCIGGTNGDGDGDSTAKTLTWALEKAGELADAWNPDHKLTSIFGMWVDEDGELDEAPDNPVWGLFYTSDDDSEGYGVLVHDDGHTDSGEGPPPDITEELGDYDDDDVEGWMEAAYDEMADCPNPLDEYDNIVAAVYADDLEYDIAAVYFFEESDKDTDYDVGSWDPNQYFEDFYARVILKAETGTVIYHEW
jgi:hypothetical protein